MTVNNSLYLRDKEKYGWIEDPPDYYDNDIHKNELSYHNHCWYKSWHYDHLMHDGTLNYHRVEGPARIWENGRKEYWLNGNYCPDINSDEEWIIKQIIE